MHLVDTNVLLDLVTDDSNWSEWSLARLEEAALDGPVLINDVVPGREIQWKTLVLRSCEPLAKRHPHQGNNITNSEVGNTKTVFT